jgi:flagellar basal-body rod protein FlgF
MDTSLYINLSSQVALRRQLDILANNIANTNTTGFKAERSVFSDFITDGGSAGPLSFVIDRASFTDFTTGAPEQTGRPLDLAITGDGFFAVQTDDGIRYTRDGRFQINEEGVLTNTYGDPVLDVGGGQITVPIAVASEINGTIDIVAQDLDIAGTGLVSANENNIGQIGVFSINDQQAMNRNENLMFESDQPLTPVENPNVLQGFVEGSNVNALSDMVSFMEASRSYESTARSESQISELKRGAIRRLANAR